MNENAIGLAAPRGTFHPTHSLAETQLARLGFVSDEERVVLARVPLTVRVLRAGEELIREGGSPASLYFVKTGWAYRYVMTQSGARQIPVLLTAGSVCNLDNLLFERADFGVRALTEAIVLALPREQALSLSAEHPGLARAFTWAALAENAILSRWAVGLGRRTAQGRLAHLLCEMSLRLDGPKDASRSFELPLTQELIADVLGLTPVHVNRTMQSLRAGGLIATAGRTVTILDGDRLRTLAEFDPSYLEQIEESARAAP